MTGPWGKSEIQEIIEGVIVWEDSESPEVAAAKVSVDVSLAINVPEEATELPLQAVADVHDAHTADGQVGEAVGHDVAGAAHGDVVMDGHQVDAPPMAGAPDDSSLVSLHDDPSAPSGE